jgi:hypothetical protein
VCKHIGVISPVGFYEVPITSTEEEKEDADNYTDGDETSSYDIGHTRVISYPYLKDKKVIDMYKVFHHAFVKNSVYPLKYRDLQLDTVTKQTMFNNNDLRK